MQTSNRETKFCKNVALKRLQAYMSIIPLCLSIITVNSKYLRICKYP